MVTWVSRGPISVAWGVGTYHWSSTDHMSNTETGFGKRSSWFLPWCPLSGYRKELERLGITQVCSQPFLVICFSQPLLDKGTLNQRGILTESKMIAYLLCSSICPVQADDSKFGFLLGEFLCPKEMKCLPKAKWLNCDNSCPQPVSSPHRCAFSLVKLMILIYHLVPVVIRLL